MNLVRVRSPFLLHLCKVQSILAFFRVIWPAGVSVLLVLFISLFNVLRCIASTSMRFDCLLSSRGAFFMRIDEEMSGLPFGAPVEHGKK